MTLQVLVGACAVLVSVIGLLSGFVGTYAALQNRALLAEVRAEMAELENRVVTKINGTYVRRTDCSALVRMAQD